MCTYYRILSLSSFCNNPTVSKPCLKCTAGRKGAVTDEPAEQLTISLPRLSYHQLYTAFITLNHKAAKEVGHASRRKQSDSASPEADEATRDKDQQDDLETSHKPMRQVGQTKDSWNDKGQEKRPAQKDAQDGRRSTDGEGYLSGTGDEAATGS